MIDIDKVLHEIVFKYNLDKHYPQYRKGYYAKKIVEEKVCEFLNRNTSVLFISNEKIVLNIISRYISDKKTGIELLYIKDEQQLDDVMLMKYDQIFIVSYSGTERIAKKLRERMVDYTWLYDEFETQGLYFEREFFQFTAVNHTEWFPMDFPEKELLRDNITLELFFQQRKYETTKNDAIRRISLEKCLFLAIIMKNFVYAQKVLELFGNNDVYKDLWTEIEELLIKIKTLIAQKQQKNIVVYWLDNLSYDKADGMPYLNKVISMGISFENAFASTPYTLPALKAMFCQKKQVDDKAYKIKKINKKNSKLITCLDQNGYALKMISGAWDCFEIENLSKRFHGVYTPASMIFWDCIQTILETEEPAVVFAHALAELHCPQVSTYMNDSIITDVRKRFEIAKKELDEQLEFYDGFLDDCTYRMYISDHGYLEYHSLFHVHCNIYKKGLVPQKVNDMFSVLDFYYLIRNIVEDRELLEELPKRDYVEIQDFDRYNKTLIEEMIKNREPLKIYSFGYKGVVTKEYIFIKFNNGKKWMASRNNSKYEPMLEEYVNDIDNSELLEYFDEITGQFPDDPEVKEKQKYSKYLYKIYNNYLKHCQERIDIICDSISSYPSKSIALRMGGDHSIELYARLPKEYQEKIGFIIDNNEQCVCKKLGIPIISIDDIYKYDIQGILLSSYKYLELLRRESEQYQNIEIIDIYDKFEKKGILCKNNFYIDITMTKEDYDVGFPFD